MGFTQGRTRRIIVIGAFAAAAVTAPALATLSTPATTATQAECISWIGARGTGTCIDPGNQDTSGPSGGFPQVAVGGPNSGNPGVSTGPLLPGQTWNIPLG